MLALKGDGSKDKAKQIDEYEDKMVMNNREDTFPKILKEITLKSLLESQYSIQHVP